MIRSRNFLDWLREQPCVVSGSVYPDGGREPAHTFKSTGGGGMAFKSTDKYALPLSNAEHSKQGGMSELEYWREVLLNRPLIRDKMIVCYAVVHSDRQIKDPAWLDDIKTDDVLVKRLVQAFAEIGYYYQFTKQDDR